MNSTLKLNKGFTIIEVVLVLAIAGLIFLMVFIALPALNAGQRDTSRRSDVSIVQTAVSNFQSANKNAFPTTTQLKANIKGKSDNSEIVTVGAGVGTAGVTVTAAKGTIHVYQYGLCGAQAGTGGTQFTLTRGTKSQYAVVTGLDNGQAYCQQGNE